MTGILVVVPCGKAKIWDDAPALGAVPARLAYSGVPFKLNRSYAERFGDAWVILSAKYGFVQPDELLPGPYDVTFTRSATNPVPIPVLQRQIDDQGLDLYRTVIGLGGRAYRSAVQLAFADRPVRLVWPFAGLPLGPSLRAIKQALITGQPGIDHDGRRGA